MRLHLTLAAWFVAFAAAAAESSRSYVQSTDTLLSARDALMLPYVSLEEHSNELLRRQGTPQANGTGSSSLTLTPGDGTNSTDWDKDTNAACIKSLSSLQRSTNPSGNCLCYNLPSLDTNSGVFRCEIRVYVISPPREGFVNVSRSNIKVSLQYNGASVSPVSADEFNSMGPGTNQMVATSKLSQRAETRVPQLLQTYMFVGQIDKARMTEKPSMAQLEALIMPTFTLTAQNTTGGAVSTNLSLNEASFVNGVFSNQIVRSDFASAQAAVDAKVAAVRNGTVAFVLPGIQIMVFPVGAIITGIWLLLGLMAYGFGTYERSVYADAYKRRQSASTGSLGKTF
ncbi:hypothetical protein HRG_007043 [Hirsutella rhossiliensis]|uniref:Uncharacterized protein n=1 Tax=Hirsutella rhossiliensis TaxID=111463 RepID=A0A9P8MTQ0_9HYPO|nr:uncharacterized protein HRG_07043 [Hirsutella rhossiliensis]KAH0961963.1 hypothetical protein HRG_07043 [Hirsutella rhossiliensis]